MQTENIVKGKLSLNFGCYHVIDFIVLIAVQFSKKMVIDHCLQ